LSAHLVIDLVLSLYRSIMRISKNYRHENGTENTTQKKQQKHLNQCSKSGYAA